MLIYNPRLHCFSGYCNRSEVVARFFDLQEAGTEYARTRMDALRPVVQASRDYECIGHDWVIFND